jgi:transcriptional regulator GlxA family with amidase domain
VSALGLLRLSRAAMLLARSNLSVEAIAHDCGFANPYPYHFSRRFHRVYGQPPGRHRRAAGVTTAGRQRPAHAASSPARREATGPGDA